MSLATRGFHEATGDRIESQLGYVWEWNSRFEVFVCTTPGCNARESEGHTPGCSASADARALARTEKARG